LNERERWAAQAAFWRAMADRCAKSPAIFCYDLINEPIVPGQKRPTGDWYSGKTLGGYDFVQFITLDPAGRKREEIGAAWIETMTHAIREKDSSHLITVGLLPWMPGTWGSLAALPFAWTIRSYGGAAGLSTAAAMLFLVGWWAATRVAAASSRPDPGFIVIDEVAAQWLVLVAAPLDPRAYAAGFLLFRLFDITKPRPIEWIERRFGGGRSRKAG
jgi:phosphatidylglycerophosphatase A